MDNKTNVESNLNTQNITNNNQNNEKNSGKVGIIVALLILLASAVGFVCYDNFINKEEPPVPTSTPSPVATDNNETESLKPWMEYILEQNITKIEVSKTPCSEDTLEKKTVVLNTEQLKNIFKKFMNYKLRLSYSGGGGWDCGESLKVTYLKNGKEYWIEYLGNEGHLNPSSDGCRELNDKDLEKALNSGLDKIENEEEKDNENMCLMYGIVTDNYLLDEYFK